LAARIRCRADFTGSREFLQGSPVVPESLTNPTYIGRMVKHEFFSGKLAIIHHNSLAITLGPMSSRPVNRACRRSRE
jgi:hypothetical protein